MEFRTLDRQHYTECYLTALSHGQGPRVVSAASVFAELARALKERGIQPLQEKIYGTIGAKADILAARQDAYLSAGLDPELPTSYLDGRPRPGSEFTGVQLWGLIPRSPEVTVTTVEGAGVTKGRLVRSPSFDMLYLPAVSGEYPGGWFGEGVSSQAAQMLANAEAALYENGFVYSDVMRTWIYLRRLLDWYGEFNSVRTKFCRERGITGGEHGLPFPASTGIQGTAGAQECVMDVLALRSKNGTSVRPLFSSRRQNQAFAYGSSFSRGMTVEVDDKRTVFVSGTASIGPSGATLHVGDREAQVVETLLSIAALIESEGASLEDICSGTLFFKDQETLLAYEQVSRLMGQRRLPLVPLLADVCRPDLLVEIEAVAVLPKRSVQSSPPASSMLSGLTQEPVA